MTAIVTKMMTLCWKQRQWRRWWVVGALMAASAYPKCARPLHFLVCLAPLREAFEHMRRCGTRQMHCFALPRVPWS